MKPLEELFLELRLAIVGWDDETVHVAIEQLRQRSDECSPQQRAWLETAACYVDREKGERHLLATRLDAIRELTLSTPEWNVAWILIRMFVAHQASDRELRNSLLSQGLDVARASNDRIGLARLLYISSVFVYETTESLIADRLSLLQEALDLFQQCGSAIGEGQCHLYLGLAYAEEQAWNTALEHLTRSLDIAQQHNLPKHQALALTSLGGTYNKFGDFERAMEYYDRALALVDPSRPSFPLYNILMSISWLYSSLSDHERALAKNIEAYKVSQTLDSRSTQLSTLANRGTLFNRAQQWESSIELITSIYDDVVANGEVSTTLQVTRILANAYHGIGSYERALKYANEYLERRPADVDRTAAFGVRLLVLRIKNSLGNAEGLQDEVEALIGEMTPTSQQHIHAHTSEVIEKARQFSIELAEQMGNYKEALRLYKEFEQFKHSTQVEKQRKRIEAAEAEKNITLERERAEQILARSKQERTLLSKVLPDQVAERLMSGSSVIADSYPSVSVLFLDIVSFTDLASRVPPQHLVYLLGSIFGVCDEVMERHGVTKIKTIGDAYMAACGVPSPLPDHVDRTARAAVDVMSALADLRIEIPEDAADRTWIEDFGAISVRIGLHYGPVVAGVIAGNRIAYDIWGDAVNVAARMESTSEAGRIHVSNTFADALEGIGDLSIENGKVVRRSREFVLHMRGETNVKGKGSMTTMWLQKAVGNLAAS